MSTMKREHELRSGNLEDPLLLLSSVMRALPLSEISRGDLIIMLQQLEYLKTATLEKLASAPRWIMISLPVHLMKLNPNATSIPPQTSNAAFYEGVGWAIGPNAPTPEMVEKAQFKDKTYRWNGR